MSDSQTRILLTTDGSMASFHAAERAVHLAGHLGAKLHVLYAVDKDRVFHAGIHYGEELQELRKAGEEATEKVAALAAKHSVQRARSTSSKAGDPRGPSCGWPKRLGPTT